jgi:hypothetical protein
MQWPCSANAVIARAGILALRAEGKLDTSIRQRKEGQMNSQNGKVKVGRVLRLAVAAWILLGACLADVALAEERKFAVLLARPRKQDPNPDIPNINDIYDQYFDLVKPNVESFAEYWDEISYGNVTISGDVFEWVDVPWPVLPGGAATLPYESIPFTDLNDNEEFDLFQGEPFDEQYQMYDLDTNGDLPNG